MVLDFLTAGVPLYITIGGVVGSAFGSGFFVSRWSTRYFDTAKEQIKEVCEQHARVFKKRSEESMEMLEDIKKHRGEIKEHNKKLVEVLDTIMTDFQSVKKKVDSIPKAIDGKVDSKVKDFEGKIIGLELKGNEMVVELETRANETIEKVTTEVSNEIESIESIKPDIQKKLDKIDQFIQDFQEIRKDIDEKFGIEIKDLKKQKQEQKIHFEDIHNRDILEHEKMKARLDVLRQSRRDRDNIE